MVHDGDMASRTTLNVSLTPELSRFVESRLRSGKYQSASELVREALRLLEGRDQTTPVNIEELKKELGVGLAQLRRGEGVDGEAFFRTLAARRRAKGARRA
jgi:antitoxin ParD1/3/4